MALNNESGGIPATMLVGPTNAGAAAMPYPMFGGSSGFGNDGGWWIVLLIIVIAALGGGWGGNNQGAYGAGQPIIVNEGGGSMQRGFDQAATMAGLSGIQSGISGLSTQLCGVGGDIQNSLCAGFAGVNASINGGVNTITQQLYANTIADLERSYAAQTASTQGMTALQAQLAQCCCDNRLATESLRATVLSENCQDRYEAANNTRNIIDSQTRSTQAILDKLCQLELDNVKGQLEQARRDNIGLQNQLNMATMQASQIDQTAQLRASQATTANQLIAELRACPIPAQPVYGNQEIFRCSGPAWNNNGCGCSGNGFMN